MKQHNDTPLRAASGRFPQLPCGVGPFKRCTPVTITTLRRQVDSHLVLAVVADATTTHACYAHRKPASTPHILARGASLPRDPAIAPIDQTLLAIAESIGRTRQAADIDTQLPARAVIALKGMVDTATCEQVEQGVCQMGIAQQCRVVPYHFPMLVGAIENGVGAGLVAGDATLAFTRSASGEFSIVGGWGNLLGNEGSTFALGRSALRSALLHLETRAPLSDVDRMVCTRIGAHTAIAMSRRLSELPNLDQTLNLLGRDVAVAAEACNKWVASACLDAAALDLARLVSRAASPLQLPKSHLVVVRSGSLFELSRSLAGRVEQALATHGYVARLLPPIDPLESCLRLTSDQWFSAPLHLV